MSHKKAQRTQRKADVRRKTTATKTVSACFSLLSDVFARVLCGNSTDILRMKVLFPLRKAGRKGTYESLLLSCFPQHPLPES
jgi:hypothetical protein